LRELDRLAAAYPAFQFGYRPTGRHGSCWTAERKNGLDPGLHTLITSDLSELLATLAKSAGAGHAR